MVAQGLEPTFPDVPAENFTSPSSLPSREHKEAGEASFIQHKGKTRLNDVNVRQDKFSAGGELTPVTNFSRPGVDLSVTLSLYIKARCLLPEVL